MESLELDNLGKRTHERQEEQEEETSFDGDLQWDGWVDQLPEESSEDITMDYYSKMNKFFEGSGGGWGGGIPTNVPKIWTIYTISGEFGSVIRL